MGSDPGGSALPAGAGLARGALVLLDSSALVYLVEGGGARRAVVESFAEAARRGELRLAVSAIAWLELLAPRSREGRPGGTAEGSALAYRRLLADSSFALTVPVDVAVAEAAAGILGSAAGTAPGKGGTATGPGLADAIHLATATVIGAAALLTNDGSWAALLPRSRVLLVDELAFDLDPRPLPGGGKGTHDD